MTEQIAHRDILTKTDARERAARVTDCSYVLDIDLGERQPTYRGDVTIGFTLSGEGDLELDYRGKSVESLEINGEAVEPDVRGFRLVLPAARLRGENTVRIRYENEFDHGGDGFHQFIDPQDGEEYLYSNFEPYEAHRLFPCFDQPDIKATYEVTVTAPSVYEVVSNGARVETTEAGDGRTRHRFAKIGPFSTYLFALIVGPYHVARDQHGDIDLGLYCRKSLVPHLDTDELFEVTKQGLSFFGEFFDLPYPWGKYDQIFVPEFNAGAMENVGAVTHNEYMVFRDPPTDAQRRERAEVILHEMAHMWFGDLVTMRWWDDLWLNESFATYMAYLCLDKATRFTTAWQDFNAQMKNWAYRQDQLVTTHPIAADVDDTDQTFLNFDGITYAKGASVLRQLAALIGPEGFREGMRHYFREHAYGNTDLRQFLASLEQGSGRDLGEWSRLWLETASLNTLSAEWQADGDRIASTRLLQTAPPDYPTIRPHRVDVGFFWDMDERVQQEVVETELTKESKDIEVPQRARPGMVLPNVNDLAYAKVALDPESVAFVREYIDRIDDALTRQLLWSALWNMVRDQQLKSTEYLAFVREKLPLERNLELVAAVLGQALAALGRYVPNDRHEAEGHALFEACWKALEESPGGDRTITWARTMIGAAVTPEDVRRLGELVDGAAWIPNLELDQDMRWSIAVKHVVLGFEDGPARVEAEAKRDPTDRGERAQLQAATAVPDPAVKEEAWAKFHGDGYGSLYLTTAAMSGFHWRRQRDLLEPYTGRFFDQLRGVFAERDKEFATTYFRQLYPSYRAEPALLEQSRAMLNEVEGEMPLLERTLKEAIDELERTIACQQFAASGS